MPVQGKNGLFCHNHKDIAASGRFRVTFGRSVRKRFESFIHAQRFLNGLRYKVDEGSFDHRDYLANNPLSFTSLSGQWLTRKEKQVSPGTYSHLKNYIFVAQQFFGSRNVKEIQYAHLEDFIESLNVSDKTKSNYLSCLHNFYKWLLDRREINRTECPVFPSINYQLGMRKTIDKATQQEIIQEVKRISSHVSPKIWLSVKWLSTYISIRPNELRNLKEGHIDRKQGFFYIPKPKERKPKFIPLIPEDIKILNSFPPGLPDLYFFRHSPGVSGASPGSRFGQKLIYKWWKKACDNLGVQDVDLYGGTRHSSAVALREHATPEQIRRATMHQTNKAFERYFQVSREELIDIYSKTNNLEVIKQTSKRLGSE
ncbi:MAG: site-specific integrase [Desulfobulbaceae bacterium]|nr:site-specific integrase [Desulfobulbaceae bacterium]